jgi:SAM-dependent methyltransferase
MQSTGTKLFKRISKGMSPTILNIRRTMSHFYPWRKRFTQTKLVSDVNDSVTKRESTKDWWESCHRKNHRYWLSGTRPQGIWESLKIDNFILPGTIVLNIGVGLGYDTIKLAKRKCIVHALDISETALARVQSVVSKTWLASQIQDLTPNTFDIAISHLVAQHMSNKDLLEQITYVVRSLKSNGIFAIQIAFPLNGKIGEFNESEASIKSGGVIRTMYIFEKMISKAGGKIVWAQEIGRFPKFGSGWYGVHIQRRK